MAFIDISDLSHFSLAGFSLNTEEKTVITTSLRIKAEEEKLTSVSLWGKINGVQRDYFIAQAPVQDNAFARKFFYSIDMSTWLQLPEVTAEEMTRIDKITKRFSGDPGFEYLIAEDKPVGDAAPPAEPPKPVSEEKRLSGTVQRINFEVEIVPRGAFYRDASLQLGLNPLFKGLSEVDLGQLTNYFHFREGFQVTPKVVSERAANFEESLDIFETIAKDEPYGCWSIQVERGGSVALLRSLQWPGYVFFHTPSPAKWGAMYFGWGLKNQNIGYMLP